VIALSINSDCPTSSKMRLGTANLRSIQAGATTEAEFSGSGVGGRGPLDARHLFEKLLIVFWTVLSRMDAAVAGRAKRDYKTRVIRTTVADAADMVGLEVPCTVGPLEWARSAATLTTSVRSREDVGAHVRAPFIYVLSATAGRCRRFGRLIRSTTQLWQGKSRSRLILLPPLFGVRVDSGKASQLEYYCLPHITISVRCFFEVMPFANPLPFKTKTGIALSAEQQKAFSLGDVIADSAIATHKRHVANLPLAEILKDPIRPQTIGVTMLLPFGACDDEDDRMAAGGDDASPQLSAKTSMDIAAPIVRPPKFKLPAHRCSLGCFHASPRFTASRPVENRELRSEAVEWGLRHVTCSANALRLGGGPHD